MGWLLLGGGAGLIAATLLVATGVLPILRPAVPPPPALVEARATSVTLADAVAPPPAALPPSPVAVFGAPPESPPRVDPPAGDDSAGDSTEPSTDFTLALVPTLSPLPTPLPTSELPPIPTMPPPPTRIAMALLTPTPRPTAVPTPPAPGLPVHLTIPSIRVDTAVVELSTTLDPRGVPQWETVPFVAGHYRMTGLAGARTNVVLSGHVLTRDMGNVFRDLHLVRPGDPVVVSTEEGQFTYRVSELRLVEPADVSVLAPSATPRLTLITCAGEFDFRSRTFTQRLVVVGDLVTGQASAG